MNCIIKRPYTLFLILFTTCGTLNDNKEKSSTGSEKSTSYFLSDPSYYYVGKVGLGVGGYDVTSYCLLECSFVLQENRKSEKGRSIF